MIPNTMRLFLAVFCALFASLGATSAQEPDSLASLPQWSEKTIEHFRTLPVLDDGRIKPLDTVARFKLLRFVGKRTVYLGEQGEDIIWFKDSRGMAKHDGVTRALSATEWMMTALFHPQIANRIPTFIVDNTEAMTRIGLDPELKRDRFSFNDIAPVREELMRLGREYSQIDSADRDAVQSMVAGLGGNFIDYEFLTHFMDFAVHGMPLDPEDAPAFLKPDADGRLAVSSLLEAIPEFRASGGEATESVRRALGQMEFFTGMVEAGAIGRANEDAQAGHWDMAIAKLNPYAGASRALALLPPPPAEDGSDLVNETWFTPSNAMLTGMLFDGNRDWALERIRELEALGTAADANDPAAFASAAATLHARTTSEAAQRGEGKQVARETAFYKTNYFLRALIFFIIALIVLAFTWVAPAAKFSRWLSYFGLALMAVPTYYLIGGIVQRCIIRSRPPVSTLYETILFITAVIVVICIITEILFIALKLIQWQKIAIAAGAFMGAAGMFMANRFESDQAVDTMPTLVAVLDTNFWLATHVTIVTAGYAGGLLAAALSHLYIFGRLCRLGDQRAQFYKVVTTLVYGIICLTLLLSLIGTVLGGIWANYSWGRFWGWDPKENGALMIVLGAMIILHARLGGYIKTIGIHIASIILGSVVVFSWWGVNNLGVGLHSYGFTEGLWSTLRRFWGIEIVIIGLGLLAYFLDKAKKTPPSDQDSASRKNTADEKTQQGEVEQAPA